jgi:FtsZ-binding cell division protein ZapB
VEKIVPELVSHDKSKDKFKSINYTNFVPLIVNAIHEFYQKWLDESQWLRAEILRLRSEFSSVKNSVESAQNSTNELRSSIEELRRENQALRRWVCAKDPSAEFCQ